MSNQNRFTLTATLIFKDALRYTPAGVPVVDLELEYSGEQIEASKPIAVTLVMNAKVLGPLAPQVSQMSLGSKADWEGFLAPRSQKHKSIQFHVCEVKPHH